MRLLVEFFHRRYPSTPERLAGQARENLALSAVVTVSADVVREVGPPLEAALAVLLTRAQGAGYVRADISGSRRRAR
jgi:hypothetical protein